MRIFFKYSVLTGELNIFIFIPIFLQKKFLFKKRKWICYFSFVKLQRVFLLQRPNFEWETEKFFPCFLTSPELGKASSPGSWPTFSYYRKSPFQRVLNFFQTLFRKNSNEEKLEKRISDLNHWFWAQCGYFSPNSFFFKTGYFLFHSSSDATKTPYKFLQSTLAFPSLKNTVSFLKEVCVQCKIQTQRIE